MDPCCERFMGVLYSAACKYFPVIKALDEPINLAFRDILRDGVQFIRVAAFAACHQVEDLIRAAGIPGQIVINAQGAHFQRFFTEKALPFLAQKNVFSVNQNVLFFHRLPSPAMK
jgi:hypothetical protein